MHKIHRWIIDDEQFKSDGDDESKECSTYQIEEKFDSKIISLNSQCLPVWALEVYNARFVLIRISRVCFVGRESWWVFFQANGFVQTNNKSRWLGTRKLLCPFWRGRSCFDGKPPSNWINLFIFKFLRKTGRIRKGEWIENIEINNSRLKQK